MKLGFDGPVKPWTEGEAEEAKGEFGYVGYSEVVKSFGVVIREERTDDYQGDTVFVVEKDGKFGFGEFGWGSCSGCDALDAAWGDNYGIAEVRNGIASTISWFDSKDEGIEHMREAHVGRHTRRLWAEALGFDSTDDEEAGDA